MGCSSSGLNIPPPPPSSSKYAPSDEEDAGLDEFISPSLPPLLPSQLSGAFGPVDQPPSLSAFSQGSSSLDAIPQLRAGSVAKSRAPSVGMQTSESEVLEGLATRYSSAELHLAALRAEALESNDPASVSTLLSRRFTESAAALEFESGSPIARLETVHEM